MTPTWCTTRYNGTWATSTSTPNLDRLRRAFATAFANAERNGEIDGPIEPKVELATLMTLGLFVALRGGSDLEEVTGLVDSAAGVLETWRVN